MKRYEKSGNYIKRFQRSRTLVKFPLGNLFRQSIKRTWKKEKQKENTHLDDWLSGNTGKYEGK